MFAWLDDYCRPLLRIGWRLGLVGALWGGMAGASPPAAAVQDMALAAAGTDTLAEGPSDWGSRAPAGSADAGGEESYFSIMARLGLGLGLVVLLAWGAVHLLRRSGLGQHLGASGGAIRIGERAYLGPKKLICLVGIGDRTLALGVTDENITLLGEWPAEQLQVAPRPRPAGSFADQLRKFLGPRQTGLDRQEGEGR
jgi:flagellar biogenesis protein FliO